MLFHAYMSLKSIKKHIQNLEKLNKQIQVYIFVSHQKLDSCFTHDERLQIQTN